MNSTVLRSALAATTAVVLAFSLSACSAGRAYSSPEDLKEAFVDAGATCEKSVDVDEDMLSEGAHGIICAPSMTFLIVFDSEAAKNRYIARTGDVGSYRVGGERWLAAGEDKAVLDKLGGTPIK